MYPGFTRRIYLKSYRYNMHFETKESADRSGAQTNTVEEMKNAMVVFGENTRPCAGTVKYVLIRSRFRAKINAVWKSMRKDICVMAKKNTYDAESISVFRRVRSGQKKTGNVYRKCVHKGA